MECKYKIQMKYKIQIQIGLQINKTNKIQTGQQMQMQTECKEIQIKHK